VKIYNEQRDETIKSIMDNTEEGTWTKDELGAMKLDVLKKLEKSVKKTETTVHVNTGGNGNNGSLIEPMMIPSVEFDKK
jgi:threonine dehydratase